MATCMVDVEPQSFFGVACDLTLHPVTGCPVHRLNTEPAVLKRKPEQDDAVGDLVPE